METHHRLTILGVALLAATFLINQYSSPEDDFNYAYITGIAMLFVFMISFYIFHKEKGASEKK